MCVFRRIKLTATAVRSHKHVPNPRSRPSLPVLPSVPVQNSTVNFNVVVAKNVKLVHPFREAEVDAYFIAFECIAAKLGWPKGYVVWMY